MDFNALFRLVAMIGLLAVPAIAVGQEPAPRTEQPQSSADLPTFADRGLRWSRPPSIRDVVRHHNVSTTAYPERGFAELSCTPDARGRLACDVIYEEAEGLGFGRAAQRVMEPVRVEAIDGTSPEGRTFGYRIRFGRWPVNTLPDAFHPLEQNLRWVDYPSIGQWPMAGLSRGETAVATFTCTARADGRLDCTPRNDAGDDQGLIRYAAAGLRNARVARTDDQPLEGSPLVWTFRITRRSN